MTFRRSDGAMRLQVISSFCDLCEIVATMPLAVRGVGGSFKLGEQMGRGVGVMYTPPHGGEV